MKAPVFTGERIVPELDNYFFREHLARYHFAKQLIRPGAKLLDVGCGDGYGTFFLASVAGEALGIDVDPETIELAIERYPRENLRYQLVPKDDWPLPRDHFDAVTCFEVFEHVPDPDEFLARVADRLVDGGLVILSTPNKDVYGENLPDPYHLKEYALEEFEAIVRRHFEVREVLGQRNKDLKARKFNFWMARQAMRFPILLRFVNWTLARKAKDYRGPADFSRFALPDNVFSPTDAATADYFVIVAEKRAHLAP